MNRSKSLDNPSKDLAGLMAMWSIEAAGKNVRRNPKYAGSAQVALNDATACYDRGQFRYAARRAADSLAYSMTVSSEVYQRAKRIADILQAAEV